MSGASGTRRRWVLLSLLATLVTLLAVGLFWPWLRPDDKGFVLTLERPLSASSPTNRITTWRSRSGRLLVRTEGLLGPLFFVADPADRTVRGFFEHRISVLELWAVLPQRPTYYRTGKLPEQNEFEVKDEVVRIATPDGEVKLRLGMR
jgi:hypothetical protein